MAAGAQCSQSIGLEMFHSLRKPFLYAAYQLTSVFRDENNKSKSTNGTCFFVQSAPGRPALLVTNRHCVDLSYKDEKYRSHKLDHVAIGGYFQMERFEEFTLPFASRERWVFSQNYAEDVAVAVNPKGFCASGRKTALVPFVVNKEMLATENDFKVGLDVCDMVAFPGYPSWFDRNGWRPIMRMGSIASDPISDYRWSDRIPPARRLAYEAFSFGGSSGSPVFALAKGIKLGGGLTGGYYRDEKLIGINCGHLSDNDEFPSHHSGLSYLLKSTAVLDCLRAAEIEQVAESA